MVDCGGFRVFVVTFDYVAVLVYHAPSFLSFYRSVQGVVYCCGGREEFCEGFCCVVRFGVFEGVDGVDGVQEVGGVEFGAGGGVYYAEGCEVFADEVCCVEVGLACEAGPVG